MSTANKLTYLNTTKGKIKDSINLTGAGITNNDTFRSYATKLKDGLINAINNGTDTIYNNFPKTTGTGTKITLNSTYNASMKIELSGNTYQNSRILPEEYTQVDYIESSGAQYIDTNIKPNSTTKIELKYQMTIPSYLEYNSCFGAKDSNNFFINSGRGNITTFYWFNDTYSTLGQFSQSDYNIATFDVLNSVIKNYNSETEQESTKSVSFTSFPNINMYLFARNNNGTPSYAQNGMKCWYFKVYENNVLKREMIPCFRNSDNVVGMYDLVNDVFYTNQGTGSFTYGNIVSIPNPDYPQDIEVVTGNNNINICGKNLLNYDNNTNVEEKYLNNSGTFTNNTGHYYINKKIKIDNNKLYYISFSSKTGEANIRLGQYKNDGTFISRLLITTNSLFTPNNECSYIIVSIEKETNLYFTNLQLEQSNQNTPYEPYQEQNYEINLGKNLFDKDNVNLIDSYILGTGDGILPSNGGTENKCAYITCKPNTTYTVQKMVGKRFAVAYSYETPAQGVMVYNKQEKHTFSSITITTDSNAKYLVVYLRNGNLSGEITLQQALDSLQIEEGSQATSYSPYFTPIEFCKIGDYKDVLFKNTINNPLYNSNLTLNAWYKYKQINKISSYNGETITTDYISTTGGLDTGATVYYVLETPTYEEITETTLINQLNNLEQNIKSYLTQTNISQTNAEQPFILDVSALLKEE